MTRIPIATDLKTRTLAPDKDARLKNSYIEGKGDPKSQDYQTMVRKRPSATGGFPVGTGVAQGGIGVAIDGANYVVTVNGDNIGINNASLVNGPATGFSPSEISGSPYATATGASFSSDIHSTPNGLFVYTTDRTVGIYGFRRNATSGSLTPIAGSPFTTNNKAYSFAITPNGRYLLAPNFDTGALSFLHLSQVEGGILSHVSGSPFAIGAVNPTAITITPDGQQIYIGDITSNLLYGFNITDLGIFSVIPGMPIPVGYCYGGAIAVSPNQNFVAVADGTPAANRVFMFRREPTGALVAVTGSPFATVATTSSTLFSSDSAYLYVGSRGANVVAAYSVNQTTGALTQLSGSPYAAKQIEYLRLSADNTKLVGGSQSDATLVSFDIGTNGTLTPTSGSPFTSPRILHSVDCTEDGRHVIGVTFTTGAITVFKTTA